MSARGERGKMLTRREFDTVIRRAAELAASDPEGGDGSLSETELFRIAGEVGLDVRHVRRALTEVRSGAVTDANAWLDRVFGPAYVHASRVVPGTPKQLAAKLDEFMVGTQLLQPVRRGSSVLQYRPAVDWASQLARAAAFSSKKYYIASAKSVEIHLDPVDDARTNVEFLVDPGTRGDNVGGSMFGGSLAGASAGTAAGYGLFHIGLLLGGAVTLGAGVAVGVTTAIVYATGHTHRKKLGEVRAEIEGVLDALELRASLEPPPPSWRRWVKRQFHGVARDLMSVETKDQAELDDLGGTTER